MSHRPGFTLEQHQAAGQELQRVLATIDGLSGRLADAYGIRGNTGYHTGHQLQKAKTALLLVRQTLVKAVEDEYPYLVDVKCY